MKRLPLTASLLLLPFAGCVSIVKKPEFDSVKRDAIVSVYAPARFAEKKGDSMTMEWAPQVRSEVTTGFHDICVAGFRKAGWEVMGSEKVTSLASYQKM